MTWFPWPRRAERKAAVHEAQRRAAQSRRSARKAGELAAELREIENDDVARLIVEGLMHGGSAG